MGIVHFFCRECKDYNPHGIIDELTKGNKTYTKLLCVREHAEAIIVEHDKGKPATQFSKRIELEEKSL